MYRKGYKFSLIRPNAGDIILDYHKKKIYEATELNIKFWKPASMVIANAKEEKTFREQCLKKGIKIIGFKDFKDILPEFQGGYSSITERNYGYIKVDQVMYLIIRKYAKRNESPQTTILRLFDEIDSDKHSIEGYRNINEVLQQKLIQKADSPEQRFGDYMAGAITEVKNVFLSEISALMSNQIILPSSKNTLKKGIE